MPRKPKLTDEEKAAKKAASKAAAEVIAAAAITPNAVSAPVAYEFIQRTAVTWPELTKAGAPMKTMMNARLAIQALGLNAKKDVFHNRYTINGSNLGSFVGDVSDAVSRKFRELSFMRLGLDPGEQASFDALRRACEENQFDPITDYLTSLRWDGTPRLGKWLTTYCGVADTPLTNAQGIIVLTAACKRAFEPGCKMDYVLVLEGPEGGRKSSVCRVLANGSPFSSENFSDSSILACDERKQMELTEGVWIYEIAELAGMKKADQFGVKNFITKTEERAREAYGRFQKIKPRICIFIGTFNTTVGGDLIEYLNPGDQRRWWGVLVGYIDIDALVADRDQLFAEAMHHYQALKTPLYLPPDLEAEARAESAKREKPDVLLEALGGLVRTVRHAKRKKQLGTTDIVLIHETAKGTRLTKHGDADAFALVRDPTETEEGMVWIAAKWAIEQAPQNRRHDVTGIGVAMQNLGWAKVDDRTGGPKRRGFTFQLPMVPDPTT